MKKIITIIMLVLFLSGCSFLSDEENEKLPVQPTVKQQARVVSNWTAKPISGDTKQYNKFSPTLKGQELLVADDKGHLVGVDKSSGRNKWAYSTKSQFSSSANQGDGKVYIGTKDAKLLALDDKTGKLLWEKTMSDQVVGKPAYANNIVAVKTLDGKLYGLSCDDGSLLWTYNEGNPLLVLKGESDPVIDGDKLIVGFPDGKIIVVNLKTGTLDWEAQVADSSGFSTLARMVDINTTPVVNDGIVYVGTYQGNISAYSLATGHRIWEHKLSTYSGLTTDANNTYVTDADGVLWAFDKKSGSVNWKQTGLKQYMLTGPVAYKNYVIVGDNVGNVQTFMKKDGVSAARTRVSGKPIYAAPITDGNRIYVLSTDGKLIALTIS